MTPPRWRFKPKQPDDTTRDPISGEFFATEAIKNSAEALIREAIQNSLDARAGRGPVRVTIRLSGDAGAADPRKVAPFLEGLAPHIYAAGNGLRPELCPVLTRPVRYLVFEETGTTGLVGDPFQWHRESGKKNHFYAFFRAEGESEKSVGGRRGRWGIGKFVFPRASYGSTFFGYTVRADDDRRMLLGRCVLKSHEAEGLPCVPDGYFGFLRRVEQGVLVTPVEDREVLAQFTDAFRLIRGDDPGLSIVIPWYDDDITEEGLLESAVRDWFYSILTGELVVRVGAQQLDAGSLEQHLWRLPPESRNDLEPLVGLTRHLLSPEARQVTTLGLADTAGAPKWTDTMLPPDTAAALTAKLDAELPIVVRIPIAVKPKGQPAEPSSFDICLQRDSTADDGRPVFVREGIVVTDAKGGRVRGVRSLVVISGGALADLLGDAEGPAHTEWRADTANFKEKYQFGPGYLTFVKQAVASLVERLQGEEDNVAPDLLSDLFSLPEERPEPPRRPAPAGGTEGPEAEPDPRLNLARTPAPYRITRVAGGFTLTRGEPGSRTPAELQVTVAYEVRRGNPFSKYDPADFQLHAAPVTVSPDHRGLLQLDASANSLRVRVTDPDFRLTVTGFDVNRDLIVRVVPKGAFGDDEAA